MQDKPAAGVSLRNNRRSKKQAAPRGKISRPLAITGRAALAAVVLSAALVLCLRWIPPPTSAFMQQRKLERYFSKKKQPAVHYRWAGRKSISPHMLLAVIAAEDQKFPHHLGFDFESILDAMKKNNKRGQLRGASTITQQVAKNLFLWSGRSYVRKGLEAYFTILLELLWPKIRILEVYVNIAEFGDGTYGVYAAAEAFLKKKPSQLSRREASLLAAVLPNPRRLSVNNPSPYVRERGRWIEGQMEQLGGIWYLRSLQGKAPGEKT
ncbi:MAG: monofunctional biosynthetic peptidoglycan transglycosylase [Pseudomonadota bacterium]